MKVFINHLYLFQVNKNLVLFENSPYRATIFAKHLVICTEHPYFVVIFLFYLIYLL